jgi:CubicO group peptidase (beta-lactamase class C family)
MRNLGANVLDLLELIARAPLPLLARCRIPRDLDEVRVVGDEASAAEARTTPENLRSVREAVEALYRTGVYPALQVCVRRHGHVVIDRAYGHSAGNAPTDPVDGPQIPVGLDSPFTIFSASKAITAMVIHKLDELRILHLEDRVVDYIPEFGSHGKQHITIRHLLGHRAGIPNLPPEAMDLDLLFHPEKVNELLCQARPRTRPGRILAYHAITSGFVLAEVVKRAAGRDIRQVLQTEIARPLGFRWMGYGVKPSQTDRVARNVATGPPVPPPLSGLLRRALGVDLADAVRLSNDPRFLTGIIPSANVVTTARELSAFYQCLLEEGELDGVRIFDPRTVHHATSEDSIWELDLTLGMPIRYGLGFMLGGEWVNLFGYDNRHAFGHVGFTNTFGWADPERQLSVAIVTNGQPVLSLHAVRLVQLLAELNRRFPKTPRDGASRRS